VKIKVKMSVSACAWAGPHCIERGKTLFELGGLVVAGSCGGLTGILAKQTATISRLLANFSLGGASNSFLEFAALQRRQVRHLVYSSERPNTRATHIQCCPGQPGKVHCGLFHREFSRQPS